MADDIRVTSPIAIQSDSKARVAFDMMQHIASHDGNQVTRNREYWLILYTQCFKAASGHTLKSVLDTNTRD